MIHELLGNTIDIHTGGIDHIPVHHTNEIAQSETAYDAPLARFWLHANHIKVEGTKMSKSLGNIYTLQDIQEKGLDLQAFKLMVLSKHYRTEGNFTWEILRAAQTRLHGWQATVNLQWQLEESSDTAAIQTFRDALENDLNTPKLVAEIDSYFNRLINQDKQSPNKQVIDYIEQSLGIHFDKTDLDDSLKDLMSARGAARQQQDWAESDRLRDELRDKGIGISDSPLGQIWYKL